MLPHKSIANSLFGKTVLITGASSGIGRSTALEFARSSPQSLKLIVTARRVDRIHELTAQINGEVGDVVKVWVKELDVSRLEEIEAMFGEKGLPDEFCDVDVLVNNAGFMSGVEQAPDIPVQVVRDVWATNVTGVVNMTQAVLKIFKRRSDGGKGDIVMIYCASKAVVRAFTGALRKELVSTRIRIVTVDPGQVLTEFNDIRHRFDKEKADKVYAGCDPLTPDDIAEVIVFAASRRENVVVADVLMFPNHQASAIHIHRSG